MQPPATTWILDSMPGLYSTDATKNSVIQVLNIVRKIPESFESRDWLLQFLIKDNFLNKAVSQWLATNVITDKDGCHLGLNVPTIVELMTDFCNLDTWPILENFEEDVSIIYLRAGNNTNWSSDTLDRLRRIEKANNRIKLLEMPNVGHWLHAEDPSGLLELIKKHSIGIV